MKYFIYQFSDEMNVRWKKFHLDFTSHFFIPIQFSNFHFYFVWFENNFANQKRNVIALKVENNFSLDSLKCENFPEIIQQKTE